MAWNICWPVGHSGTLTRMAPRPTWKGFLSLSLVNLPVAVYPATSADESISFNQLHAPCHTRIQQKRWCPTCDKEIASSEIVKGFEFERGRYVEMTDDDLDQVETPSTRRIAIDQVDYADALDPMHIDRTYYLAPDGPHAANAYAVLAAALEPYVAVGKVALYGREYLVALRAVYAAPARTFVLLLHTLHHASELRSPAAIAGDVLATRPITPPAPREIALAKRVVAALRRPLDLATFTDERQVALRALIDAKIAGDAIVAPTTPAPIQPTTTTLHDALRASLASLRATRVKPPRATAAVKKKKTAA
jgi:DNA end-binding protein Ku